MAADIAKVVVRLDALGISGVDMAAADDAAVRSRALSLRAQELVKRVPVKVLTLPKSPASHPGICSQWREGKCMQRRRAC